MVASVSALTSSAQASSYYEADDYYAEGGLSPSEWQGAGAEALNVILSKTHAYSSASDLGAVGSIVVSASDTSTRLRPSKV